MPRHIHEYSAVPRNPDHKVAMLFRMSFGVYKLVDILTADLNMQAAVIEIRFKQIFEDR